MDDDNPLHRHSVCNVPIVSVSIDASNAVC
jgi:hypothetical protein